MNPDQPCNSGQLKGIVPFLKGRVPRWLILGGPADGDEAQTALALWPGIKVVAVEPNPEAVVWQRANGWPAEATLVEAALWYCEGTTQVLVPHGFLRSGSTNPERLRLNRDAEPGWKVGEVADVPTVTLDRLSRRYGPFEEAVLWLDTSRAASWRRSWADSTSCSTAVRS